MGHVYATRDVLRPRSRRASTKPRSSLSRSRARPARSQAWDVGSPLRSAGRGRDASAPAARRARARARSARDAAIDGARRGSGALIELVGETGSGKSRLLAEARQLAEGMRVLRATCEVFTRDTPYFRLARSAAPAARGRLGRPGALVLERLEDEVGMAAGSAPLAAADRDRASTSRSRARPRSISLPPRLARPSCARWCSDSSAPRWSSRLSSSSSTRI